MGRTLAQSAPDITEADLARVRRETPTVTDQDIDAARRKYGDLRGMEGDPAPAPRLDALPRPQAAATIDLNALAKGYAAQTEGMQPPASLAPGTGPGLLVFVSLTMPEATLQRLLDQAARVRAPVLIRGLARNSLRETAVQVQALIGSRSAAVRIDPQAFDRFAISRVPSFVLLKDGKRPAACAGNRCAAEEVFVKAAGDVSLDYALETMQRSAPRFGPAAEVFLKRIKE
ncbi:MAG: type-F conjugative transfer system pilin assembly protein TrbC [Rhodocyclaceae bacterium]|nr:MAG: type-F conjugative transfer system pilin assembly protein TrbC [Rhodocyclaceae bacterium]